MGSGWDVPNERQEEAMSHLVSILADSQHTHAHAHNKAKKRKNSTLERKDIDQILRILDHKNVNKRKNRLTLAKFESIEQDKNLLASREGSGGAISSSIRKKPRPI